VRRTRRSSGTAGHYRVAKFAGAGAALIPLSAVFVMDTPPAEAAITRFTYSLRAGSGLPGYHTPVVDKIGFGT
jgi:hypothetical protein